MGVDILSIDGFECGCLVADAVPPGTFELTCTPQVRDTQEKTISVASFSYVITIYGFGSCGADTS